MLLSEIKNILLENTLDEKLKSINVSDDLTTIKNRYLSLIDETNSKYGDGDYCLLSASGRSEIGGNHTDHQHGKVLAAAVNMDNICLVKKNNSLIVDYTTLGFNIKPVDLNNLESDPKEKHTSESLIRGIAARFKQLGYQIGGFSGLGHCNVLMGSGISSSASFEILIAEIFNHLFNNGEINPIEIAKIAQYAENNYFLKPCGLLDQMAISVGGFVYIDFKDPTNPIVEKIDFNFKDYGYNLVLVNTKGDHANLSDEYASIPKEIKEVANLLGSEVISDIELNDFIQKIPNIRNKINNDRAILRAIHVLNENKLVDAEVTALKNKDIKSLFKLMKQSGNSSFKYLQNIYVNKNPQVQNLSLALSLSESFLTDGAYRVHGGGFEGTIQAIVSDKELSEYLRLMKMYFGDDCCFVVNIRPVGGYKII